MNLLAPGIFGTPVSNGANNNNALDYPNTPYFSGGGVSFTVSGDDYNLDYFTSANAYVISDSNYGAGVIGSVTPAPIPGAGLLSYLALGLGGLLINRKRIWRAARMVGRRAG
jgi:hypothetical protein